MLKYAALFLAVLAAAAGLPDPCEPGKHTEVDEDHRSTGYMTAFPEHPRCDSTLHSGWYRFTGDAGGMMPEVCPDRMRCGTVVPVWLNGTHPGPDEGMVSRQACANFETEREGSEFKCCEHSLMIGVKNCVDFFVYYLKPTVSCPMAYCAGDKEPCPVGTYSDTGFQPCERAYPALTAEPVLSPPIVDGKTFHFDCTLTFPTQDPDQAFDVVWTFDDKEDPSIPPTQLLDPQRTAHLDGALLEAHMGHNVGCSVRARYMSHGNTTGPWIRSNTYWAGIRTGPGHLVVSEKETGVRNVTLTSTVPILCDHDLDDDCCLNFRIDVDGPKENIVSSHACQYAMCKGDWNEVTHEATVNIPFTAAKDQITDGNKDLQLSFEKLVPGGGGPYLQVFNNYKPMNLPIDVQDSRTRMCSWTGDPHIHGMNHAQFHLFKVGDYTMYENRNRDFEVQARTWPCNNGRVTCICGVTIREKNDVIRISECDQPYRGHHTSPHVEVAGQLREGTVIQRSTDGYHIMVYMPSGAEIKIDGTNFYLNTYLTVPGVDAGEARGICGTYDDRTDNEFTRRDGGVEHQCTNCVPTRFTESWNNNKHHSLFERVPPHVDDVYEPRYCRCDKDYNGVERINCTASGDITNHNLKCHGRCHTMSSPPTFMDPGSGWTRRAALYVDRDEKDPKFDPDNFQHMTHVEATWPTPSGITQAEAEAKCRATLAKSQLHAHCTPHPQFLDMNLADCVTDILYGDTYDMMEAALAAYSTECQSELSRDPNNYVTNAKGDSVLKPELSDDVCSVTCLRHGHCQQGTCVCDAGYTGDNCNILAGKGPQLAKIRSNSTCDLAKRPCRKVFIDATNLENQDSFACKVLTDGAPGAYEEPAEFLGAGRLACHLPNTQGDAQTQFRLTATNDGSLYSNTLHLTVFDGTCLTCDQQGRCTILPSTCKIDKKCYQDGDANPADASQLCSPAQSATQWSAKPTPAGKFPHIASVELSPPNSDFALACGVEGDATARDARFQVTWLIDNVPTSREVLAPGQMEAYLSVKDLPAKGEIHCMARSFVQGATEMSQYIHSKQHLDLATMVRGR